MVSRRLDALHLEGQPAAVVRRVWEELRIVARATERGDVLAVLVVVGIGGLSVVDTWAGSHLSEDILELRFENIKKAVGCSWVQSYSNYFKQPNVLLFI